MINRKAFKPSELTLNNSWLNSNRVKLIDNSYIILSQTLYDSSSTCFLVKLYTMARVLSKFVRNEFKPSRFNSNPDLLVIIHNLKMRREEKVDEGERKGKYKWVLI